MPRVARAVHGVAVGDLARGAEEVHVPERAVAVGPVDPGGEGESTLPFSDKFQNLFTNFIRILMIMTLSRKCQKIPTRIHQNMRKKNTSLTKKLQLKLHILRNVGQSKNCC